MHDLETAQTYLTAFQALYNVLGDETLCTGGGVQVFLPIVARDSSGTPPVVDIRITGIEYDPPGDDVEVEYLAIQNFSTAADISG